MRICVILTNSLSWICLDYTQTQFLLHAILIAHAIDLWNDPVFVFYCYKILRFTVGIVLYVCFGWLGRYWSDCDDAYIHDFLIKLTRPTGDFSSQTNCFDTSKPIVLSICIIFTHNNVRLIHCVGWSIKMHGMFCIDLQDNSAKLKGTVSYGNIL